MSTPPTSPNPPAEEVKTSTLQNVSRWLLGGALLFAGISHLTFARKGFQDQVPRFVPLPPDLVVILSGLVEITLGVSLIVLSRFRKAVGFTVAGFFVAIFPGNISQYINHRNGLGLNTDTKRFIRLFGQPGLVAWALWATGALQSKRKAQ